MDSRSDIAFLRDKREVHAHLFRSRMWREYAMKWDKSPISVEHRWVKYILQIDRAECLRRAWVELSQAREQVDGQ